MIGKNQVGAGTDLDSLRRYRDALGHQSIRFLKESFRIDHHAVAEHAGFARVNNAGR